MGSTERWFGIKINVHEENDGPRVLRHGLEKTDTVCSVDEVVSRYGKEKVVNLLAMELIRLTTKPSDASSSGRSSPGPLFVVCDSNGECKGVYTSEFLAGSVADYYGACVSEESVRDMAPSGVPLRPLRPPA